MLTISTIIRINASLLLFDAAGRFLYVIIVCTVLSRHYYCGIDVARRSGSSKKVAQTRLLRDNPVEVGEPGNMGCSHCGETQL